MKKLLALLLAFVMVFSVFAGCQGDVPDDTKGPNVGGDTKPGKTDETQKAESEYPEYLNLDSAYPIIKDEYAGTIKLKVAVVQPANGGEWENLWISKYLKEKYNVEFEVTSYLSEQAATTKQLMFAGVELPDLILNFGLTTTELYEYGDQQGLLLAMDEYMDETLTPDLLAIYNSDPNYKKTFAAPDGHLYGLPGFSVIDQDTMPGARIFVDKSVLDELGIAMPKTLNEFVDAMYKVKEANPDSTPIAGGFEEQGSSFYILNALGYLMDDFTAAYNYGFCPAIRDGEVVIPAYDTEVFAEYLKIMKQFYDDGIISSDFFTMDGTAVTMQLQEGQSVVYRDPVYTKGLETWDDWEALYPLTSDWQTEPEWTGYTYGSIGNFVISADTEYPELCLRIANMYCNVTTDDPYSHWIGPGPESEWNYGYVNEEWDPETNNTTWDSSKLPEGVDLWTYLMGYLAGWQPSYGLIHSTAAMVRHVELMGYEWDGVKNYDPTNPDDNWRISVAANQKPYAADCFPKTYFVDGDTSDQLAELKTLIDPYVKEQVALFITGRRALEEVDDFAKELESMGIEDMLAIYQTVYENAK